MRNLWEIPKKNPVMAFWIVMAVSYTGYFGGLWDLDDPRHTIKGTSSTFDLSAKPPKREEPPESGSHSQSTDPITTKIPELPKELLEPGQLNRELIRILTEEAPPPNSEPSEPQGVRFAPPGVEAAALMLITR
jgi:hypothetical protein